jgi:predicted dehydrogenase
MGQLTVAVVGLGLGRVHVRCYAEHEAVERLVVCDTDEGRAGQVREETPAVAAAYPDLEAMLEAEPLDAVSIVTPDHLHRPQAERCLAAGCHVLLTKPLATNLQDGRAIVRAAEQARRVLMVAHEKRFRARARAVRRALAEGEVGNVVHVRVDCLQDKRRQFERSPWYASAEAGRTAMVGTAIHQVDLLRYFVGRPVVSAFALGNHLGGLEFPGDTTTAALFRFAGGAIGQVTVSYEAHWPAGGAAGGQLCLIGTEGLIVDGRLAGDAAEGWRNLPPDEDGLLVGTRGCVDAFLESVLTGAPAPVDGREAFASLAACVAADEAAAAGRPVEPAPADF